ncbi:LTA synthase family protein [Ruminobacter sp. RM87]|uniref:LTA synthase family protein n=1 Tax=Ruminobacter sp. RM87 TaxID=1200567 RepID=UPI00068F5913|nr:LTA synthase family protein [Ruminobacter sp. RM87]
MVLPYIVGAGVLCAAVCFMGEFLVKPGIHHKMFGIRLLLIHLSIFYFLYGLMLLFTGRIVFSAAVTVLVYFILIVINNAKYLSLREPLVFSDYDYFTDAFRFPRLYFPFLGVTGILGIIVAAAIIILGFCIDSSYVDRFGDPVAAATIIGGEFLCLLILFLLRDIKKQNTFCIRTDIDNMGFAVFLWSYFLAYLDKPQVKSPFEMSGEENEKLERNNRADDSDIAVQPNLIAIQSESFFDPRKWNPNIREDILKDFDEICGESESFGKMEVPAWGANTIRTEFSFLTGISPEDMKGHRFSPYQISSTGWPVASFVNMLKRKGYHTVCIHPYYSGFYHRDVIFRKWEFDEFLDITSFGDAERFGPYVADSAIANKLMELCDEWNGRQPLFVFMITMENHGPLNLESITEPECQKYFKEPVSFHDYKDLAVYLRHLANENSMLKTLKDNFEKKNYPVSMVFYGDHVPILPKAYELMGEPEGRVPYFIWNSSSSHKGERVDSIEQKKTDTVVSSLAVRWLNRFKK